MALGPELLLSARVAVSDVICLPTFAYDGVSTMRLEISSVAGQERSSRSFHDTHISFAGRKRTITCIR